jgi:methyltransferase (TIGR00027 family)
MTGSAVAGLPEGVGRTALGVARIRAAESRRDDRLFEDPYADAFVAAAPEASSPSPAAGTRAASVRRALAVHVVLRTRFFDDYLLDACATGVRQVVLLAAGLDTRSYRLTWPPGVGVFEVDLPDVLAFKEQVLRKGTSEAACERVVVPVDLRDDWVSALRSAGFDPSRETAWLVEGLLIYLAADDAARVLTALRECSADGSTLALEQASAAANSVTKQPVAGAETNDVTELWQGGLGADAAGWLRHAGWTVQEHALEDIARTYGRPLQHPSGSGFITAQRC